MTLHFLSDDAADASPGEVVTLTGAEAKHAASVRRVRVGETVTLGDGRGAWLVGECRTVASSAVEVEVLSRTDHPAPAPEIVLVQALAKGDRDELAVQAATELGADRIIPWQAARSVSRWDAAKAAKGRERWQTIAREAAKQAHRAWVPAVTDARSTTDVAALAAAHDVVVLEPTAADRLTDLAPRLHTTDRNLVLVVGPEGGIAAEERTAFQAAGATERRLGSSVLRTSTAGPAAIAVVSAILGRW
jgi:16S rRNA (uracil1498-N3)-methyltransferase